MLGDGETDGKWGQRVGRRVGWKVCLENSHGSGLPSPLLAPSCPARRRRLVSRDVATQPGAGTRNFLSMQTAAWVVVSIHPRGWW